MARISGLERNQAPWHLRWFYGAMRKMFGKDLTPVKMQMRKPGLVWGSIAMEARPRSEASSFFALYPIGESPNGGARRVPVLSRHQFCRGQKGGPQRREIIGR